MLTKGGPGFDSRHFSWVFHGSDGFYAADGSLSVRVFRERSDVILDKREVGYQLNPKDTPFVNMAFLPLNHVVNK